MAGVLEGVVVVPSSVVVSGVAVVSGSLMVILLRLIFSSVRCISGPSPPIPLYQGSPFEYERHGPARRSRAAPLVHFRAVFAVLLSFCPILG